ncbi:phosphatase PAP2 family protein [Cyclobacterium xiamenense]|jgi:undecaprenyl-diphosphatase|uniref:phosphatase PAP2 family protein n=1 Tax=Cyclobacterium xiamenense TaxID=1297121 RepID=UPI0012B80AC7|nr:phosphatase PAP2 family protein [Cyclobacterium xiamenense]
MIHLIQQWDEAFFLFLNGQHAPWLDPIMLALTGKYIWVPLYLYLLYLIIRRYPKEWVGYVVGLILTVVLADQLTSGIMKPFFERLRPCHDPRWDELIRNYAGCGGRYGFASSHAANTFALASFMQQVGKKRMRGMGWLFGWAALVSYTRIYLGVHYPLDVLVGAAVGVLVAWLVWWATLSGVKVWQARAGRG